MQKNLKEKEEMKNNARKQGRHSWPKTVIKKLLHISKDDKTVIKKLLHISKHDAEHSADEGDNDSDYDEEEEANSHGKLRRRNSETLRAQYINTKELRVCVGTWNAGGKLPSDDLDIEGWLDMHEPADIYVLGLQELVPLNAGNIFGVEDKFPVQQWECLIRDTLSKIRTKKPSYQSYSEPTSPPRFNPDYIQESNVDECLLHSDTDTDNDNEAIHPINEGTSPNLSLGSMKSLRIGHQFTPVVDEDEGEVDNVVNDVDNSEKTSSVLEKKLIKTLSSSERIGLVWPEQSLYVLAKSIGDANKNNPLRSCKSCGMDSSFKQVDQNVMGFTDIRSFREYDSSTFVSKKRKSSYVRIVSKKMVGVFLSVWVRRSLRKHIQNLKVSTVGVGIMGYMGNKGSVSVSMSVYQTPCCFICTHLSSGEKNCNEIKRNSDVQEIHRRTRFSTGSRIELPQTILDHERIIWFGDLNHRINLPYGTTHELVTKKKWSELFEGDQLKRELKKGHVFDGWSEGVIKFPPTYKYEFNSNEYIGDDLKGGRRTPAWCDRILSFGTGMKLINYRRSELKLSDHRPVTATYLVEVEVFSHRKLQKALTLTDAEIEDGDILSMY